MGTTISVGRVTFRVPERVFLDANFIVAVRVRTERFHKAAAVMLKKLIAAASANSISLYTSPEVVDEVWWSLGKLLYEDENGRDTWNKLDRQGRKRALWRYSRELVATTNLLRKNQLINIADVTADDIPVALDRVTARAYPLEPRDAFHLAVMIRLGIQGIATNDHDFRDLPSIVALPFNQPAQYVA
jgi:predicted nucleic acid-binding protein